MATRNHTKGELLAQLEQQRVENQHLRAENQNLRAENQSLQAANASLRQNQAPKKVAREYGIPRPVRDAFFRATGLKTATPKQIKAWAGALS